MSVPEVEAGAIWVFIEHATGEMAGVSKELLGKATQLAVESSARVWAVVLGHDVAEIARQAIIYGAAVVLVVDDPALHDYRTEPYAHVATELVRRFKPETFLIGGTGLGRDLASPVATLLGTGLTADCTALDIDTETGLLRQSRPAFGGNVMATIVCKDKRPQMATVRPHVFEVPAARENPEARIYSVDVDIPKNIVRSKVLEFIPSGEGLAEVETAEIIISAGRGLGGPDKLNIINEIAGLLGAAVGASRPVVEMGWLPQEHQVGQTGRTVRPKLYMAVGISGAVQHIAGMQHSEVIVAINSDADASIFSVADIGIVGDLFKVLPEIKHQLRHYLSEQKDASKISGDEKRGS